MNKDSYSVLICLNQGVSCRDAQTVDDFINLLEKDGQVRSYFLVIFSNKQGPNSANGHYRGSVIFELVLQCLDAVGWAAERASGL